MYDANIQKNQPLVSILMALYKPQMEWMLKLLDSLVQQTYSNIEILIQDDCPGNCYLEKIDRYLMKTSQNYTIYQNEKNLGSDKTYEILMKKANGTYAAFCDQDDIWDKNKIEKLVDRLDKEKDATMVYSDMRIIDAKGTVMYSTMKEYRSRIRFVYGKNVWEKYFFNNCTAGCSIVIKKEVLDKIDVIPKGTYWDHWVCIVAAVEGKILFDSKARMSYRVHFQNQSGIFANITSKDDYYRLRVEPLKERLYSLKKITSHGLENIENCVEARCSRKKLAIWKNRNMCEKESWFEICLPFLSEKLFEFVVNKLVKV